MKLLTLFLTLCAATAAYAQPDLEVTLSGANSADPYEEKRYRVNVENIGDADARNVEITIELPETATSPSVFIMGVVGDIHRKCAIIDTTIVCNYNRIKVGKRKRPYFDIAFPVSTAPHTFTASAVADVDGDQGNNSATKTVTLDYIDTPIAGPRTIVNRHCTGQGLQGFYECTLFPSSISTHSVVLEANGDITFTQQGFSGSWSQILPDRLELIYRDAQNQIVAAFHGYGIGNDCFEGITVFPPNPPWMAPYEVCLQ